MQLESWKILSSRINESFPIFNLRTDKAVSPRTNKAYEFYILESANWVNVIPITSENNVILIRQYRHGIRDICLEIPGGIIEDNDSPEEAARRELKEETGYAEAEMLLLGSVHPNPAFLNNLCYTYLARNVSLSGEQDQDEKEDIEIVSKSLDEIPELIRQGAITHSLVIAAFYRFFMEFKENSRY